MSSDTTHRAMRTTGRAYGCGTARCRHRYRLSSPLRASNKFPVLPSLLCEGGRWMALPGGVALTLLAVMLRSTPLDKPPTADTPAVALEPVPSPAEARAVIPAPPVNISPPRIEQADLQFDQVQMPSAPTTPGTELQLAKKATHHVTARTAGKTRAVAGRSSPFVIHGVLTPPDDPTVRRDAGH